MPRFVPRQRKHKVLARKSAPATDVHLDSNQDVLLPTSKADKEAKRQQMRTELRLQQTSMSSKKQKRLDKYIENKLKKDENRDYLRRLEKEREAFDVTGAGLESSKNLNSRKRRFDDFVEGQVKNDNNGVLSHKSKSEAQNLVTDKGHDDEYESSEDSSGDAEHSDVEEAAYDVASDASWLAKRAPPVQGTGLAQPLQLGLDGLPIIQVRGRKREQKVSMEDTNRDLLLRDLPQVEEVPWDGFESEDDAIFERPHEEDEADSLQDESSEEENTSSTDEESSGLEDEDESGSELGSDSATSQEFKHKRIIQPRASAFKAWATQQLNQAVGHVPSYNEDTPEQPAILPGAPDPAAVASTPKEIVRLVNGLPEVKTNGTSRAIHSVHVERSQIFQEARMQLPILQKEQEIMEAIHNNPVVVVKGATGSGKTTQLPQFLYEAGYGDVSGPTPGLIGITQPRRVAAVSMAKRVSEELGSHGNRVSHQIRFDSTVSSSTAIKFMTDGILLRELSQDLLLKKYSAIIIDEAHERSVNTDILIGILSKIVPARMRKDKFNPDPKPLKLIIMSATLNIDDFMNDKLFPIGAKPPIVEAEGRQHRVTTHFALKSRADYLEETLEKVKKAHKKLPRGGILVFLTGKNEIQEAHRKLRQELGTSGASSAPKATEPRMHFAANESPLEVEDLDFGINVDDRGDVEDDLDILTQSADDLQDDEFDISDDEEQGENAKTAQSRSASKNSYDSVHILPLYSQLPTQEQLRVFDEPPEGSRLIVLATNVAETSLTIPGIRYVFDCGRSKERKYNLETGVQSFEIDYISKASAQQRAGRAGRTGPGHCWRLYTSALFEQYFPEHNEPEILRAPAESVVLQVKGFAFPKPVAQFPFPSTPGLQILDKAERVLRNLGALTHTGTITDLGKELSLYPVSPRLSKILAAAVKDGSCVAEAITLVAGLSVSDIFVNDAHLENGDEDDDHDSRKQEFGRARATLSRHDKTSDGIRLLTAVNMFAATSDKDAFCKQYFLKPKPMSEVSQLLYQLRGILQANHPGLIVAAMNDPKKLAASKVKILNTLAASGYIDQVAIRWDSSPNPPLLPNKPRRAIDVPYLPLIPLKVGVSAEFHEKAVFIHPSSVLSRLSVKDVPQYIVYTHLQQAQAHTITGSAIPKTRMFPLAPIDASSLARLARETALIEYGKPVQKTKIEELSGVPKRRICWVTTELKGSAAGSFGWSLPPSQVRQVIDVKSPSGWRVEEILT